MNRDVVIGEVQRAGFVLAADYDFVKPDGADYFLIFEPSLRGPLKRTPQNSFRSQERFSGSGCFTLRASSKRSGRLYLMLLGIGS